MEDQSERESFDPVQHRCLHCAINLFIGEWLATNKPERPASPDIDLITRQDIVSALGDVVGNWIGSELDPQAGTGLQMVFNGSVHMSTLRTYDQARKLAAMAFEAQMPNAPAAGGNKPH